jgi:hypothetical protein
MRTAIVAGLLQLLVVQVAPGYPLDGAATTGIRRLAGYRLANEGKIKGTNLKLPAGAMLRSDQVVLRLRDVPFDIMANTPQDPFLKAGIDRIFGGRDASYAVAILDITDPHKPLYASFRGDDKKIPGSVGKLCVVTGLFGAIAVTWPAIPDRQKILRDTIVDADSFIISDSKTVPFYQDGDAAVVNRQLRIGDKFSLYEWTDHMLSQSSNAAGSMMWKQAMLIRKFGTSYPRSRAEQDAFLKNTPRPELGKLALAALEEPLAASGIDTSRLRLGTFFTKTASNAIPGSGSYACPNELLRWLVHLEQGRIIDEWSSLEIKKLLYFVRPRYRYALAPALNNAAVFFKSGSLFECSPPRGCKPYAGNVTNLMHSVAIVESGEKRYLVAMMSNVLGVNSATEHAIIAGEIEKLIQSRPRK